MIREFAHRRTQVSFRVAVAAVSALALLGQTAPAPALAAGNAGLHLSKTVDPTQITVNPALGLTLGVDKASAIPGDTLTYTAVVTNAFSTFGVGGTFRAVSLGNADATVSYYWDELESCVQGCGNGTDAGNPHWVAFAGFVAGQTGYVPVMKPDVATGLTLTATGVPATGVTYPAAGDGILGTVIQPQSTATWNYQSSLMLTPSQIAFLSDPTKAGALRNVVHFEVTIRNSSAAEPYIDAEPFTNPFQSQANVGSISNLAVTFTFPDGTKTTITSSQVAGLALLAPGASLAVITTFKVPVPAARTAGETDAAYMARLVALEGSALTTSATASGTGFSGPVTAGPMSVTTAEHLPIVTIVKSGPTELVAGNDEINPLALQNIGGASASGLAVTDSLPGGATGTVTGAPTSLTVGQGGSASATFTVPATQTPGNLTDTAAVTWQDANRNNYGPLTSSFTTLVKSSLANAKLTLAPTSAGPDIVGNSQAFTAHLADSAGQPVPNRSIVLSITGANHGTQTVSTDAAGDAHFTYVGANQGTDQVQATLTVGTVTLQSNTVSVSWIAPFKTVSTTLVSALVFFNNSCGCFAATPASTPVFSMQVPTINFNPPAGTVPHNPTQIGVLSRPMFDVTTDVAGNFTGAIELKGVDSSGVLHEAGTGDLFQFDMVLTGTFTIASAGDLTFNFFSDDGFIFGIQGATRVSGALQNPPASMLTAFNSYPVMGAFNQPTAPIANNVTVNFPAPGAYSYEIDYNECCGGQLALTLATNGSGLPPTGNIALTPFTIAPANVGQTQTLHASVMDASGAAIANQPVTLNVTGANPLQLSAVTDPTGLATFSYQGASPGVDSLQASAQVSGVPELSNVVTMTWNPAPPAPTIGGATPADGSVVTKPIPISATITAPAGQSISSWVVTYQASGGQPFTLNQGTGAPPVQLATFDPTLLPNGSYTITITANASGGGVQTSQSSIIVSGGLKIGRYTTTYQDMSLPVTGVQMEVRRSYDSIDTASSGDFGFGWRVSVSNFRVATNHTLGAGGWTQYNQSCALGLCLTAFKNPRAQFVTVVYPDGHTEVFDFIPTGGTNIFVGCTPVFTARASLGTTSMLIPLDDTSCSYTGDGNLYGASGFYNPQKFQLTTRDGRVIVLDHTLGLISITDRNGNKLTVDANGVHASNGQGILFTRDGSGRITQVTGPAAGQTVTYTYSLAGDLATSTDPLGNTNTYTYDSAHHLLNVSGAQGAISTATYDASGRLISITDANHHTMQIANNVAAQTVAFTDPLGVATTVQTMDDQGDVVREDITSGGQTLTTLFQYDSVGHVTRKTDALGHSQLAQYNAQGDLTLYTDGGNNPTQFVYNDHGQLTSVVAPDLTVLSSAVYDSNGNPTTVLGPSGSLAHFTYDSAGRPVTRTDTAGNQLKYAYDATGRMSGMTDPANQTSTFQFDAGNRLAMMTDPIGNSVHFSYDGAGNLTGFTDGRGIGESFTYNPFGNVLSATDPLGGATVTYDADGNVTSTTNRASSTTSYTYDANGRLTRISYPGGEFVAFTFDGFGRPTTIANSSSSIDNSYDAAGHLISSTTHAPSFGSVSLAYTYDPAGNRLTSTGPDGTVTYAYDANSRLTQITDPKQGLFGIQYDSASRITALTRPNGITDNYTYDVNGRLVGIASKLGATTVQGLTQTLDANGQVTSRTDNSGTTTYTHDLNGRLVAVSGSASQAYAYDAAGNRTSGPISTTSTYNAADELISDSNFTYTYDAEGQRISKVDHATSATTQYFYNGAKQLTSIQYPDHTTTTYTYDPLGRRLTVSPSGGATTAYVYDGVDARLEYNAGALTASYVGAGAVDRPLEMTRGANSYYYLQNFQGSVTSLTDSTGSVAASYSYDAFGVPTSAPPAITNPFTYAGREYDPKSGLYYNRARYYEPTTGSFISQDPAGSGQRYTYASGDPVDFVDPSGGGFIDIGAIWTNVTSYYAQHAALIGCVLNVLAALIEVALNFVSKTPTGWVAMGAGVAVGCAFGALGFGAQTAKAILLLPVLAGVIGFAVDSMLQWWCTQHNANPAPFSWQHAVAVGFATLATAAGSAAAMGALPVGAAAASQFEVALGTAILSGDYAGLADLKIQGGACG
jgi:RHS repeat-associated protein